MMKKGLFHKRIPTLAALGILLAIVGVSLLMVQQGVFYVGRATPQTEPQNVAITNISDTSFTVVFTTPGKTSAVVNMQGNAKTAILLDDRDKKTGQQGSYYSHHISVPNLEPNTTYTFALIVGNKTYTDPAYTAKTGPIITSEPPAQNPLFGSVLLPDGTTGTDTIVIAKPTGGEAASAITNGKGQFIIPANSMRTSNLSQYLILKSTTPITIDAFREMMKTTVQTTYETAQNLPPIMLLQTYRFISEQTETATESSLLSIPIPTSGTRTISIRFPTDNQSYTDSQPLFSGTAYPGNEVKLMVKNVFTETVNANSSGVWSYRSSNPLPQGQHILTMESADNTGQISKLTRSFFIFPSGAQVAQSATPTATLIPTKTPTPTLRPSISVSPTAIPSISITPSVTATPTATPTVTPTPTKAPTPTPLPPISAPGGELSTFALTAVAILLIAGGTVLIFVL